jgi:hypothetical protein
LRFEDMLRHHELRFVAKTSGGPKQNGFGRQAPDVVLSETIPGVS